VRHRLVKAIIKAYEKESENEPDHQGNNYRR
jgi:phosphate starvation-inducible protein PhoH